MKKMLTIFLALTLITLAGCGKNHNPSSSTEETAEIVAEEPFSAIITTTTNGNVDASIIKTETSETGYVYTVFVSANDAYAIVQDDCVKYLDTEYKDITEVKPDVNVTVWNINGTSTTDVCAFVRIESPTILDMQKVFISVFGTTDYQEGMVFESVDEYKEQYGTDTLVSMFIQTTDTPFNTGKLYATQRPIYESLRLINLGNGYDIIHISTEKTKSYIEDDTLWTPVDIINLTGEDYSESFTDMINNTYIAQANINGTYEDISIIRDTTSTSIVRIKEGTVEVGITNYHEGESAPNCVVGNIILKEGVVTLEDEIARRAIIIFFN